MSLYYTTMDRQLLGYHFMYYPLSYLWNFLLQTSIFVYNFYSGVNFCGKQFAVVLFCGNLSLRIAKETAKIAKIKSHKNLVPHGMNILTTLLLGKTDCDVIAATMATLMVYKKNLQISLFANNLKK